MDSSHRRDMAINELFNDIRLRMIMCEVEDDFYFLDKYLNFVIKTMVSSKGDSKKNIEILESLKSTIIRGIDKCKNPSKT